jgi:hypothetical protein
MRLPALNDIPATIDRWDMHRFLEAALAGLRSAAPIGFLADHDESAEEVLRLIHDIEDAHPELQPEEWPEPWGSGER